MEYFLRLGVASAVYDCDGNCAVSLMIEKMPQLAKTALDQFFIEDKPNRKNFYYLSNLEFDVHCKLGRTPARPVLEVKDFFFPFPTLYLKVALGQREAKLIKQCPDPSSRCSHTSNYKQYATLFTVRDRFGRAGTQISADSINLLCFMDENQTHKTQV